MSTGANVSQVRLPDKTGTAPCFSQGIKTGFLIGLPRSGTTLLASLLAGNNAVLSLSEPFLSRTVCRHRFLNFLYFPRIRGYRLSSPENCDEIGFLNYLKKFTADVGFSILVIKETYRLAPYLHNTAVIDHLAVCGDPVVAITRHPYDTAVSTMRMFRNLRGIRGKLMRSIVSGLPEFSEDREIIDWVARNWQSFAEWCTQRRPHILSYENLVRDPSLYLQNICERLEIPFTPEMLDNRSRRSFFGVSGDTGVLTRRKKKLLVRPVGRSSQLKPEFTEIIKAACGKAAEEAGYVL